MPLPVMPTSGLPLLSQMVHMAATPPAAAASSVMTAMSMTGRSAASSEPGLKPNQPTNRITVPRATSGMLWPRMARGLPSLVYLPRRGPRMSAPMRAAQPPTLCTMVEPAKSLNGVSSWASQPPPQVQCTTIG